MFLMKNRASLLHQLGSPSLREFSHQHTQSAVPGTESWGTLDTQKGPPMRSSDNCQRKTAECQGHGKRTERL